MSEFVCAVMRGGDDQPIWVFGRRDAQAPKMLLDLFRFGLDADYRRSVDERVKSACEASLRDAMKWCEQQWGPRGDGSRWTGGAAESKELGLVFPAISMTDKADAALFALQFNVQMVNQEKVAA